MSGSELRVRLRGKAEPTQNALRGRSEENYFRSPGAEMTPEERLRKLQENSPNYSF